jgi:hypothetical protein
MKNFSKFLTIALFAMALALSSCNNSTNTTTTPVEKNYFPMAGFNDYWIYEKYQLDTTSQKNVFKISGSSTIDSISISNLAALMLNQTCAEFTTYNSANQQTIKDYFYSDVTNGQQLFCLSDYVLPTEIRNSPIALPISIPSRWVLLADNASASNTWTLFDTTLSNVSYTIPNYGSATINGDYKITGVRGNETSIEVDSSLVPKYYTAKEFDVIHTFTGSVTYSGITFNFPYSATLRYWYADGIGLVKYQLDPISISVNIIVQDISFVSPGSVMNLIRHKLN